MVKLQAPSSGSLMQHEPPDFKAQYHRLAGRRGKKRAIGAVKHSLLVTVYFMLAITGPTRILVLKLGTTSGAITYGMTNESKPSAFSSDFISFTVPISTTASPYG
jgi:hypothetical protein